MTRTSHPQRTLPALALALVAPIGACAAEEPSTGGGPTCGNDGPTLIFPSTEVRFVADLGERYLIQSWEDYFTVGPCGEDPLTVGAMPEGELGPATEVVEGKDRVWLAQDDRVGLWPADGSAPTTWSAGGDQPLQLWRGRGYVVWEEASGNAVLVGIDGSRRVLFGEPVVVGPEFSDGPPELPPVVQTAGSRIGLLDEDDVLRFEDVDVPGSLQRFDDVPHFALAPDGSYFIAPDPAMPGDAIGTDLASGQTFVAPGVRVHPIYFHGRFLLQTNNVIGNQGLFDVPTRTVIPIPDGWFELRHFFGDRYGSEHTLQWWDPLAGPPTPIEGVPDGATLVFSPPAPDGTEFSVSPGMLTEEFGQFAVADADDDRVVVLPVNAGWVIPLPGGRALYTTELFPTTYTEMFALGNDGTTVSLRDNVRAGGAGYATADGDVILRVVDSTDSGLWRFAVP